MLYVNDEHDSVKSQGFFLFLKVQREKVYVIS